MYLSNRLTFSLFSVLLVAALLVAPTAMAQVTVEGYQTTTPASNDPNADPQVTGTIVFTFTYSEAPSPRPGLDHFTADDDALGTDDMTERDVLTASYMQGTDTITAAVGGTGTTVTLTLTGSATVSPTIPSGLTLRGYSTDLSSGFSTDMAAQTTLALADGYIGGKTYVVYVRGTTATVEESPSAHLPVNFLDGATPPTPNPEANSQVIRTIFPGADGNSNVAMPDLEDFFWVGGGTIDLNVAGTAKDSRHLIINEVMWALDDRLVGLAGHTSQQWIEVYNRLSTPAPAPTFVFTNNTGGLNPPDATVAGTSDRLSNIPSHISTWNVKGENGSSMVNDDDAIVGANPVFKSMYRKTDKQNADGTNAGHWEVSGRPYLSGFYGTPGKVNTRGVVAGGNPAPSAANPAMDKVLINEVYDATGGDGSNKNDWLELRALKNTNLENWTLSYVNNNTQEHQICRFPKKTINAGEIWLIVNTDPNDDGVNLASGTNLSDGAKTLDGHGETKYLVISDFKIPAAMGADSLLILRRAKGWERWTSRDRLEDMIGTGTFSRWTRNTASPVKEPHSGDQIWDTKIFPLNGHNPPDNNGKAGSLLHNNINFSPGKAWSRKGNNKGWLHDGGEHAGFRGGIGYDRAVMRSANPNGTPGYPNGAYKADGGDVTSNVRITEIMVAQTSLRNVVAPQWIEIKNQSKTVAVNLHNVRLTIINHDTTYADDGTASANWDGKGEASFLLRNFYLRPLETVLIASSTARQRQVRVPADRIWDLYQEGHKGTFGMTDPGDPIINPYGFLIKLEAKGHETDVNKRQLIDLVGNLGDGTTDRRGNTQRFDDPEWSWMTDVGADIDDNGHRSSYVRMNTITDTTPDDTMDNMFSRATTRESGRMAGGWMLASMDARTGVTVVGFDETLDPYKVYYGFVTDFGTPGQTVGQPLPVELSFFRPTLENGKVTIQWTTESELDNAGFNILRSDTRNGEFKQVNEQMIQGKGTTAERSTYKWVDTTAKPGVIYYYQIEDVSFAGEHNTLAITKLKGLISAEGKLTTSWGDIKKGASQ